MLEVTVAFEVILFFVVVDLFGHQFVAMGFTLAAPAAAGALAVLVLVLLALPPGSRGARNWCRWPGIAGGFMAGVLARATWGRRDHRRRLATLTNLLPFLTHGGVYVIEDIHPGSWNPHLVQEMFPGTLQFSVGKSLNQVVIVNR